jgi:hypothetical protein
LAAPKDLGQSIGAAGDDRYSSASLRCLKREGFADTGRGSGDDDVATGEVDHLVAP